MTYAGLLESVSEEGQDTTSVTLIPTLRAKSFASARLSWQVTIVSFELSTSACCRPRSTKRTVPNNKPRVGRPGNAAWIRSRVRFIATTIHRHGAKKTSRLALLVRPRTSDTAVIRVDAETNTHHTDNDARDSSPSPSGPGESGIRHNRCNAQAGCSAPEAGAACAAACSARGYIGTSSSCQRRAFLAGGELRHGPAQAR